MKPKKLLVFAMMLIVSIMLCATAQAAVTIDTDPTDPTHVYDGMIATFNVEATCDNPPMTYQWEKNAQAILGATSFIYTTPPVTFASDNGAQFRCVVTDADNSPVSSQWATLLVEPMPPVILTQPEDQTVLISFRATFSVVATGTEPLAYLWFKNGIPITGATGSSYTTLPTTMADEGTEFRCVVYNAVDDTPSDIATLTVTPRAPTFVIHPIDRTVDVGKSAVFRVWVLATDPVYKWECSSNGGTNWVVATGAGATGPAYNTGPVTTADHGKQYRCKVHNQGYPDPEVTSNAATLTVAGPPSITTHPAAQTVDEGQTATFTVVAAGSEPLTYQWQKDGGNITGATSDSYTTPETTAADDGSKYRCVVTNPSGSVTSNKATLTVQVAPGIATQPTDQTVYEGYQATFSVVAAGTLPLTYKWQLNGEDILANADSASYTTPKTALADDGSKFRCVVSDTEDRTVYSNEATLTVLPAIPIITTQPTDQTVYEGYQATFSVVATSPKDLSYQWQKDGGNITGKTSASYTTPATTLGDNGAKFRCVVSDTEDRTVYSDEATLTVLAAAPTITTQPTDQSVAEGYTATFSIVAAGTPPLTYQWQKNGVSITGAATPSYTTPATTLSDDGSKFRCMVINDAGTVYSNEATLTVLAEDPSITTQPTDQTVNEGDTATFSVVATGSAPLTYQWERNGDTVGTDSPSYTTEPVTIADDNGAKFRCKVSNAAGNYVYSNEATLTVQVGAPTITTQPTDQTVNEGDTATFSVAATGSGPLTYQWQRNAVDISGANSTSYTTDPVAANDNGAKFRCKVTDSESRYVYSNEATLTVQVGLPVIVTQPTDQTVNEGETATFSVAATDSGPLTYQWQKGGTDITGATSTSYTTLPATANDNGTKFRCRVHNAAGDVYSNEATLIVLQDEAPTITTQPTNQTANEGETATFNVAATGTLPLTYQWQKGGLDISGATSTSYTTPPATASDNGVKFRCKVHNAAGDVYSNEATLIVLPVEAPTIITQPTNQTVNEGETATFSVAATGTLPLTYQWQKDGTDISGATSTSYTSLPATANDNGAKFRCKVHNAAGDIYSNEATLTVQTGDDPAIVTHPADQTVNEGETATFSVTATGTAPLYYQWERDGSYITGAESASYTTDPVTIDDDGAEFSCEVSNSVGTVTSNKAVLTVITEPTATFPFEEGFESGELADYWTASSTGTGRILVTALNGPCSGTYQLTMDSSQYWSFGLNELVLNINLAGQSGVMLRFDHKEFNDDGYTMPSSFDGSNNSDGVAISADGNTWYKVQGLTVAEGTSSSWQCFDVDLDAAVQAAGISYNGAFKIKFQQYGRNPIVSTTFPFSDGFAFDNIEVYQ